jgi:hypothetical protein
MEGQWGLTILCIFEPLHSIDYLFIVFINYLNDFSIYFLSFFKNKYSPLFFFKNN